MKIVLYIIAALILSIWGLAYFGFHSGDGIHILLLLAGMIVLIRIVLSKQLSRN
jgi:hypothetical protein